jgi:predicted permease
LVACAFGNATGLPITLLTVVSTNFPSNTDLGRIDPTLFLSIYLLLYPVLQWGIGGWLLAPEEEGHHSNQRTTTARTDTTTNAVTPLAATATTFYNTIMDHHHHHPSNVVSVKTSDSYNKLHRGMAETDASLYISVPDGLYRLGTSASTDNITSRSDNNNNNDNDNDEEEPFLLDETDRESSTPSYSEEYTTPISVDTIKSSGRTPVALSSSLSVSSRDNPPTFQMDTKNEQRAPSAQMLCSILQSIFSRCLQPPVIGALAGIFVASQPWLRGIFVDLVDRKGHAPLQFLFDGLYEVGQSAVPMNMIILGCNLSASYNNSRMVDDGDTRKTMLFSRSTSMAIVAGKMIIMPIIGFVSVYLTRRYYWDARIPDDIDGGVYLVAMIVFLTPTANNVMVMVELSGSGSKQAMARSIAWQYALAPVVLSITMTVAVSMAIGLS